MGRKAPSRAEDLEEVMPFRTLRDFFTRAPAGGSHPRFGCPTTTIHKYAHGYQTVNNASLNLICAPPVGIVNTDFSSSQH
jgi:hypothetical protein